MLRRWLETMFVAMMNTTDKPQMPTIAVMTDFRLMCRCRVGYLRAERRSMLMTTWEYIDVISTSMSTYMRQVAISSFTSDGSPIFNAIQIGRERQPISISETAKLTTKQLVWVFSFREPLLNANIINPLPTNAPKTS